MGTEGLSREGVDGCVTLSKLCRHVLTSSYCYGHLKAVCVKDGSIFLLFLLGGGGSLGFSLIFSNTEGFTKYRCRHNSHVFAVQ